MQPKRRSPRTAALPRRRAGTPASPRLGPPRQQRPHPPLPGGKLRPPAWSALPAPARGQGLHSRPRSDPSRTGSRAAGRPGAHGRGSRGPGGGRGGRLGRAGSPENVAPPRAGWGLGRPRLPAAPRNPDAFHLASAASEAARPPALSAAPSRSGRGRRPRPAAEPDHPHRPHATRSPPGPNPTARPPAGRAPSQAQEKGLGRSPGAHLNVAGQSRGGCREPEQQQDQEFARGRGGRGPGGRHPSPGRSSARRSSSHTRTQELSPPRPRSI